MYWLRKLVGTGNDKTKCDVASGNTVSPGPRYGHESVVVNKKLLVWGGRLLEDGRNEMLSRHECFVMDLHSQQWSPKIVEIDSNQDESPPCAYARCTVINDMVYSFGGWYHDKGSYVRLNETSSLDFEKMRWKKVEIKGNKPTARSSCGLCSVGEKLVMFGGMISHTDRGKLPDGVQYKEFNSLSGFINDCWEFCPHEVLWTPLVTLGRSPSPRRGHSLTAVSAVRIVLYGGQDATYLSDMHLLDYRDGVWTWSEVIHSEMWPKGRAHHITCCVSPSLCVVMGGWVKGGDSDGDAYVFDIERGTAHRITLGDARAGHTACCRVASDGSALIFVFGGTRDNRRHVKSVISNFCVYSWDVRTPTTISVCDNPTAWLQCDVADHQLGTVEDLAPINCSLQNRASTESNGEPSASSSTHLPVENETVREEAIKAVNEVVIEDVCDKGEEETTDELTTDKTRLLHESQQLKGDVQQLRRRLREVNAENNELVSHLRTSDREKEELLSQTTQFAREVGQITQQCESLRAEKEELSTQMTNLTQNVEELRGQLTQSMTARERLREEREELISQVQHLHENVERGKEVAKQSIEENRRLHQLCMCIHSEDNSQLMDELQQSCYLQQTHLDDFHIKCCLGKSTTNRRGRYGCNSIIYHVERTNTLGVNYAMKAMINPYDVSNEDAVMEDAEIEALFKAEYDLPCGPHPNVVRVLHHFCASVPSRGLPDWPPCGGRSSLFLVMKEYDCNLQSHCRQLRQRNSMDEHFLLTVLLQLLKGIEHLVKHNVLHRDFKLDNILLKLEQNGPKAVICDFGCSYVAPEPLTSANARVLLASAGGNTSHHSPELSTLSQNPSIVCDVSKADVWAAGLMAYEMTGRSATDILSYSQKQTPYTSDVLPPLGGTYSVTCERVLQQLVSHSVGNRPSASQAIQLCCIALYGPTIPSEGEMRAEDVHHWLEQQLAGLRTRSDEELLRDPFYIRYLDLLSPQAVTNLINTFLMT